MSNPTLGQVILLLLEMGVEMSTGTLSACGLPQGSPQARGLQEMDVNTFARMSPAQRIAWYTQMLVPYDAQVRQSASCNGIPPQLLATVILNELADINWLDVWQQRLGLNGSLGIGQIQVDTAIANRLVEFPGDSQRIQQQSQQAWRMCMQGMAMSRGGGICPSITTYQNILQREMVKHRLTIPEFSIEAAAREVRRLLDQACANLSNPWPSRFNFTLTSVSSLTRATDIYQYIDGANVEAKEQNLAEMVVAAYNSPQILIAQQQSSITPGPNQIYRNGMIHGANSRFIAAELLRNNLFH